MRASSCWSTLDETRHPRTSWISFVQPSNQATTVILCPRPCNLERGKISPDTLHNAPMTFHLVNPFSSFLCLFFVSRIFRFLLIFSTFEHRSKILEGKAAFCTGHERYYKNAKIVFTHNFTPSFLYHYWTLGKLKLKISTTFIIYARKKTILLYSKERRKFIISMNRDQVDK